MYGYIRFYSDELKVKDLKLFKAYYCGLCRELKESYGQRSRLLLSYDMTFMAIFLDALKDEKNQTELGFCPTSPLKKKPMIISKDSLSKAAMLTVLMGYYKMEDAWQDDKNIGAKLAASIYKKPFQKSRQKDREMAAKTESYLKEFYLGEQNTNIDLDTLVDPFATLVAEIMAANAPEDKKSDFHKMGYHAGRWLYFIDALDDLPQDVAEKKFNAFTHTLKYHYGTWQDFYKQAHEDIHANIFFSLDELTKVYLTLNIKNNKDLIENIFFLGIRGISELIFARRNSGNAEKFAVPFKIKTSCSQDATIKE
ncbi:MAG: DUF5685 family protein [Clostridiales bacterium]